MLRKTEFYFGKLTKSAPGALFVVWKENKSLKIHTGRIQELEKFGKKVFKF